MLYVYRKNDPSPSCPYGKKCTYGNKCKFYHPERGMGPHKSVTERLSEHAARHLSARNLESQSKTVVCGKSLSVPLSCSSSNSNNDSRPSNEQRRKPLGKIKFSLSQSPINILNSIQFSRFSPNAIICTRCMQHITQR